MIYSYIITMLNHKKSVQSTKRCIESAKQFGYYPKVFKAITPEDKPLEILKKYNMPLHKFKANAKYSKLEPSICCFLSHYELWKICVENNQPILVLEHDAIFKSKLPENLIFQKLVNLGKPSYGQYNVPNKEGMYDLFSKNGGYLPGTHAYIVSPDAAKSLINHSVVGANTPDLYMNKSNFPWITEYYPWPIEADDSFTTVQKEEGSIAKHNYGKDYEII